MKNFDPTDENGYCPECGPRHFFLSGPWFHQQHIEAAKKRHPSGALDGRPDDPTSGPQANG